MLKKDVKSRKIIVKSLKNAGFWLKSRTKDLDFCSDLYQLRFAGGVHWGAAEGRDWPRFILEMMNFVFKMMNFGFEMTNFGL